MTTRIHYSSIALGLATFGLSLGAYAEAPPPPPACAMTLKAAAQQCETYYSAVDRAAMAYKNTPNPNTQKAFEATRHQAGMFVTKLLTDLGTCEKDFDQQIAAQIQIAQGKINDGYGEITNSKNWVDRILSRTDEADRKEKSVNLTLSNKQADNAVGCVDKADTHAKDCKTYVVQKQLPDALDEVSMTLMNLCGQRSNPQTKSSNDVEAFLSRIRYRATTTQVHANNEFDTLLAFKNNDCTKLSRDADAQRSNIASTRSNFDRWKNDADVKQFASAVGSGPIQIATICAAGKVCSLVNEMGSEAGKVLGKAPGILDNELVRMRDGLNYEAKEWVKTWPQASGRKLSDDGDAPSAVRKDIGQSARDYAASFK